MSVNDGIAAAALRLIAAKGTTLVLTRANPAAVDVVTDAITPGTPITGTFKAVGLPPGKSAESKVGSLVDRNIIEFHIARYGTTMQPAPGDVAAWAGQSWTIINETTYDPAADGAIYTRALAER